MRKHTPGEMATPQCLLLPSPVGIVGTHTRTQHVFKALSRGLRPHSQPCGTRLPYLPHHWLSHETFNKVAYTVMLLLDVFKTTVPRRPLSPLVPKTPHTFIRKLLYFCVVTLISLSTVWTQSSPLLKWHWCGNQQLA